MSAKQPTDPTRLSVLAELRSLIPSHSIDFADTLRLAERQAELLLQLRGIASAPVPSEIVTALPRINVVHHLGPVYGISHWNGLSWIITLNTRDPRVRRRVTLLHEYAHIIWHGSEDRIFASDPYLRYLQAEQAADYFAYTALIPAKLLTEAWIAGAKHIGELADQFEVSEYTILARLIQLRLWLPAHHRRQPHWSQLLSPVSQSWPSHEWQAIQPDPEAA